MQVWFGSRTPIILGKSYAHDPLGVRKQVRRKGSPGWKSDTTPTFGLVSLALLARLIYRACPVTWWICWSMCILWCAGHMQVEGGAHLEDMGPCVREIPAKWWV